MSMERLFVARVLLTVATIGYGLLTVKADFNKTHAANPLWIGHARLTSPVAPEEFKVRLGSRLHSHWLS
jgi:hypothetical protein